MNILFLLRSVGVGGVEVVSVELANKFVQEGHNVSIFARESRKLNSLNRLSPKINVHIGVGDNACKKNVALLHKVYVDENIDVVVNQWGLSFMPIRLARKAEQGHAVKIISFYHNDPLVNGQIKNVEKKISCCRNFAKRFFLVLKYYIVKKITSVSMKYVYYRSNRFMVLSYGYLRHLQNFINVPPEDKQGVLQNPITIDCQNYEYNALQKKKELLFCGRMDNVQKCVFRVLDVWAQLQNVFPDWSLVLIGEGPDRVAIENSAKERGLKNISFEGFQKPLPFYKSASCLIMTSEFEGFPLVLAECMVFGVVPCVYDSFDAVHDIIRDNQNGVIVEKINGLFSAKEMADRLAEIMSDDCRRETMAQNAIETSKKYSIDSIYKQWEIVLREI